MLLKYSKQLFCLPPCLLVLLFCIGSLAAQDSSDLAVYRYVGTVRLTSNQPGVLDASWDVPEEAPDDYRIRWAKVDESYLNWTDSGGNAFPTSPSYTITGLDGGFRYKVQVRPRYDSGPRPWSDEAEIQVMAPPTDTPPPPPTNTPVPPPTNTPSQTSTNTPVPPPTNTPVPPASNTPDPTIRRVIGAIRLTSNQPGLLIAAWDAPEERPIDYRFSWAKVGEPFLTWTDSSGNAFPSSPSHTVTELEGGARYKVRARPRYDSGPRPWTAEFEIVVLAPPTDTPIPPTNTPSPTASPRGDTSQNIGRSVNANPQGNQPRQEATARRTPTATATATASSTATPTLAEQSQNQQALELPSQEPIQPKQATATPTREFARQHGTTATHTPTPTNTPHPDRVALEAIYDARAAITGPKTTAGRGQTVVSAVGMA